MSEYLSAKDRYTSRIFSVQALRFAAASRSFISRSMSLMLLFISSSPDGYILAAVSFVASRVPSAAAGRMEPEAFAVSTFSSRKGYASAASYSGSDIFIAADVVTVVVRLPASWTTMYAAKPSEASATKICVIAVRK